MQQTPLGVIFNLSGFCPVHSQMTHAAAHGVSYRQGCTEEQPHRDTLVTHRLRAGICHEGTGQEEETEDLPADIAPHSTLLGVTGSCPAQQYPGVSRDGGLTQRLEDKLMQFLA